MNKILGVDRMKKFFLLFTLMLLVFNYSYSVSKIMPENDWKVKKLKGKVKTMVSKIDEYDYSGKVENKIEIVTNFNENGYITEEVNYYNGDKKQTTTTKQTSLLLLFISHSRPLYSSHTTHHPTHNTQPHAAHINRPQPAKRSCLKFRGDP